jgi:alpha-tubulin suppressor-like RCC1 family protein
VSGFITGARVRAVALAAGLALVSLGMAVTPAAPAAAADVHLLYGWGVNAFGASGNRLASNFAPAPVPVTGLAQDVAQVAVGQATSVALHTDGTVWTWGSNLDGELGDGSAVQGRTVPGKVQGLPRVVQVAAGADHFLAVGADGSVWAWGANFADQLGDGRDRSAELSAHTPVRVLLSGVTQVDAGVYSSIALRSNGEVWTWGSNAEGELGNQSSVSMSPTPVRALTQAGVTQVAAGNKHLLALGGDGSVWTWGGNFFGELGNGTVAVPSNLPVRVDQRVSGITQISAGAFSGMAVGAGGVVWTWGRNNDGQIGDGTQTDRPTPVVVTLQAPPARIAAGQGFDLAVLPDGTLWGWGELPTAEIQHPSNLTPTRITGVSGVVQVAAAYGNVLMLMAAQPATVPNFQYLQDDTAGDTAAYFLDGVGLTLGGVSVVFVDCQFSGMIMGQDPPAGTVVPALTAVSVVLVDPNLCL